METKAVETGWSKMVCAWCSATIREGALPVSHGLCAPCGQTFRSTFKSKAAA